MVVGYVHGRFGDIEHLFFQYDLDRHADCNTYAPDRVEVMILMMVIIIIME